MEETPLQGRQTTRKKALADYIMSLLDREVWLSKDQLKNLGDATLEHLPADDGQPTYPYCQEVCLLTRSLYNFTKEDLMCLSEAQTAAVAELKKELRFDGHNLRFHRNNGSEMTIPIIRNVNVVPAPAAVGGGGFGGGGVGFF